MRGDETQQGLGRSGPRHAAPRKTLLNRIQGPAGKAMALAAMPTAVFVGMGLAPNPALADEKDIPFAPGPCVTRSDEPVAEETTATPPAKATETAKPEPTATATGSAGPSEPTESSKPTEPAEPTGEPTATPSGTAAPTATATPDPEPTATASAQGGAQEVAAEEEAAPTATPTPTKSVNPLDPLGVGDALTDFFNGLAPQQEPTAAPTTESATPTPSATTAAPQQKAATTDDAPATEETSAEKPSEPTQDTAKDTAETATEKLSPAAAKTKAAIEKAAEQAGAEVEELPESAQGLEAKQDTDIPDGAKPRFPCPEPDPAALAAAELEPGIPLLPDEPWRLDTTLLTLKGLKYHGIVEVKTSSGQIKKVLKFTADNGVDIKDLHQTTVHSDGFKGHVRSNRGSTSTITGGRVTMYTESIKGNLFGIIPVEFTPQTPPPLDVPLAIFSNATVIQAGQFGGTLRVPGLRNTIEPG
ncbi:hypothetical protein [Streptomyces sp. CC208A]|uniref:hypothetical protein n=1 Tax=Streptomyces sp. CC208A TaxID=3044573 RepID=UPI0024A7DE89|nr:hypothetical protein [Streptomyces sp. CC208A]